MVRAAVPCKITVRGAPVGNPHSRPKPMVDWKKHIKQVLLS